MQSHQRVLRAPVVKYSPYFVKKEIKHIKIKQEETVKIQTKPDPPTILNIENPLTRPKNWAKIYSKIQTFRLENIAPVDTMGCALAADSNTKDPKHTRYQTLVALQLSSQTKDALKEHCKRLDLAGGVLCPESMIMLDDNLLNSLIGKVGFHNKKTKYLKETATILVNDYKGDIPNTVDGLIGLPGVGPKMAYLTMQVAWKQNVGIGVDVHVHRISNRLGWVKTSKPEDTRKELEGWLPKEHWGNVNGMLVGFGQTLCMPLRPKCSSCPVSDLCPKRKVK